MQGFGDDINKLVSLPAHGKQLFCQRFERNLSFANVSHPLLPSSEDNWIKRGESEIEPKAKKRESGNFVDERQTAG